MGLLSSISRRVDRFRLYVVMSTNNVQIDWKTVQVKGVPFVKNRGSLEIKKGVVINSCYDANPAGSQTFASFVVEKNAYLLIDEGAGISNSSIYCATRIIIGKNVYIGGDCKIYDTDFHSISLKERISGQDKDVKKAPVLIEDGVFIGAGSIVLKGVCIGRESVIGAGSVVTKNVPPLEIWAGNPARFIKKSFESIRDKSFLHFI